MSCAPVLRPSSLISLYSWDAIYPEQLESVKYPEDSNMIDNDPSYSTARKAYQAATRNTDALHIYTDASCRRGFVAIGTSVPKANVVRDRVLGYSCRTRDGPQFFPHPSYQGTADYGWTSTSGELYALVQAVELALEHA